MVNDHTTLSKHVGLLGLTLLAVTAPSPVSQAADAPPAPADFAKTIQPLLAARCYECHGDGAHKGGVAFDEHDSDEALVRDRELWAKVLKNVRAGLMPPPNKAQPTADEKHRLERWIKYGAFGLDPAHPDPGRVTLRRLNRVEYRNTVRDLIGVDFRADEEFPPDDTGHGFDNLGDVLTVSPLLLEKYLVAAQSIVNQAVPVVPRVMPEKVIAGNQFRREGPPATQPTTKPTTKPKPGPLALSYYEPATATYAAKVDHAGKYRVTLDLSIKGTYAEKGFDYNRAEIAFSADGKELLRRDYGWHGKQDLRFEFDQTWEVGQHPLSLALRPLTSDPNRFGALEMRLVSVTLTGPDDPRLMVRPKNYAKIFGEGDRDPATLSERRDRARTLLTAFATKAFRRPVDERTVNRLVALAEGVFGQGGKTFEAGVAHAMVAVLASPRFIFREERAEPVRAGEPFPLIDEYSLASRLSYFLWSSMPDEQLLRLAAAGDLRRNLPAQVRRMLADPRSSAFVENFTGQWLQARDVEGIVIDSRRTTGRETLRRVKLVTDRDTRETRVAMHQETERYFDYVLRENRSLLELIDSDYTFVNERLANYYGIPDVKGDEIRRVKLPEGSPRGGLLTSGTVLLVTSNPTRTSPVKRGLFVLDNVLGTPTPPPPPDIPSLEDASKKIKGRSPTLRESLELHRASPVCSSCHNRMDPLGLAFENFDALGIWRDKEKDSNQPIDPTGKLITGEPFKDVRELKRILATRHATDFYRCITEKLLTYALGRGMEYYDVETVDRIVSNLERDGGHFSTLLTGVIESAPFQRRRTSQPAPAAPGSNASASSSVSNKGTENTQP